MTPDEKTFTPWATRISDLRQTARLLDQAIRIIGHDYPEFGDKLAHVELGCTAMADMIEETEAALKTRAEDRALEGLD